MSDVISGARVQTVILRMRLPRIQPPDAENTGALLISLARAYAAITTEYRLALRRAVEGSLDLEFGVVVASTVGMAGGVVGLAGAANTVMELVKNIKALVEGGRRANGYTPQTDTDLLAAMARLATKRGGKVEMRVSVDGRVTLKAEFGVGQLAAAVGDDTLLEGPRPPRALPPNATRHADVEFTVLDALPTVTVRAPSIADTDVTLTTQMSEVREMLRKAEPGHPLLQRNFSPTWLEIARAVHGMVVKADVVAHAEPDHLWIELEAIHEAWFPPADGS